MSRREQFLAQLADLILRVEGSHPLRLAVDGIDAAGKTTLADELAAKIEGRGGPVLRASLDDFHRPRVERYQKGADSPDGYYADSFDYDALVRVLLDPLGPGGDRWCRFRVFDHLTDTAINEPPGRFPEKAVLILDGVFLLRPELNRYWDFRIFVEVDFEVALQRALQRDQNLSGSMEAVAARYHQRYFPAQRFYLDSVKPRRLADVIVDNNDFNAPAVYIPSDV